MLEDDPAPVAAPQITARPGRRAARSASPRRPVTRALRPARRASPGGASAPRWSWRPRRRPRRGRTSPRSWRSSSSSCSRVCSARRARRCRRSIGSPGDGASRRAGPRSARAAEAPAPAPPARALRRVRMTDESFDIAPRAGGGARRGADRASRRRGVPVLGRGRLRAVQEGRRADGEARGRRHPLRPRHRVQGDGAPR